MSNRVVHRTCTLCEASCGISVEIEQGRPVRIRGDADDPLSRGHVCPKVHGLLDLQDDPDRLRGPVRRTADGFEPIGWNEAIDLAARGLAQVRDRDGNDAVALYRGNPTVHDLESLLYWNVLQRAAATRNQFSAGSVDTWPRWVQAGSMYGGFLNTPVPDLDRCDHLLVVGANPLASNGSLMTAPGMRKRLAALRARGGKLVVLDPRRSETADVADEHLFVRPGSDAALLLAMVHVLFEDGRVDVARLDASTTGLKALPAEISAFTPERVADVCGVDAETIRRLARDFASAPRAACYGRMGACVQSFGTLACWAIDLLNLVSGNFDREGGVLFPSPAASLGFAGPRPGEGPAFGRTKSRVSGYDEIQGEFPMAAFAEEIETAGEGRIRALAIIAGNPVASAPHSARIAEALESLDFMVAFDFYINETTRHADVILPPSAPLEHDTYALALLHFAVRNVARWSPRALDPPAASRSTWSTLLAIAQRLMGLEALSEQQMDDLVLSQLTAGAIAASPFAGRIAPDEAVAALGKEPGPERLLDLLLRCGPYGDGFGRVSGGLTLAGLQAEPHGIDYGPLVPSGPARIATPDGRIALTPRRITDDLPRLRAFVDAGPGGDPLLIGRRDMRSMNSWLHNLPSLAKGRDRCTLQVAADDARRLGLTDGGLARIRSRVGEIVAPVEVSDRMAPGVVSLPHGYGHDLEGVELEVARRRPGVNVNLVVDDAAVDVPSGTSVLNGVPVEVSAVS